MEREHPTQPAPQLELEHLNEYVRELHAEIDAAVEPYAREWPHMFRGHSYAEKVRLLRLKLDRHERRSS